jgi:chemotaxis protein histidine kinase CheA
LEPISTGPEVVKVNFKAIVTPKEDLLQVDREVEGTPKVTLLKVVRAPGTKTSLYGSLEATRIVDKWTLGPPQIQIGSDQFGNPRGTFSAQSYVTGSSEATAALKQQAANAAAQELAQKLATEKREREEKAVVAKAAEERKARELQQALDDKAQQACDEKARIVFEAEKARQIAQQKLEDDARKAQKEAEHKKLLLATLQGSHYSGTVREGDENFVRISLTFTEQKEKESVVRVKIVNPDNPKWWRNLIGELHFEEGAKYPIVLVTADEPAEKKVRSQVVNINCTKLEGIYVAQWEGNSLRLLLTGDDGMEGEFGIPAGILGVPHALSVRLKKGAGSAATISKPK